MEQAIKLTREEDEHLADQEFNQGIQSFVEGLDQDNLHDANLLEVDPNHSDKERIEHDLQFRSWLAENLRGALNPHETKPRLKIIQTYMAYYRRSESTDPDREISNLITCYDADRLIALAWYLKMMFPQALDCEAVTSWTIASINRVRSAIYVPTYSEPCPRTC